MDDEIKRILDISNKANEIGKIKEIKEIAEEKDSLKKYLSERELEIEEALNREKHGTTKEIIDSKKKRIEFSIKEYVEMATTGYPSSIEESIKALFVDKQTIVHCTDNNTNYSFQEIPDLIDFIKSNTNEKQN